MTVQEVETPHGPARVHLHDVQRARGALVLGHGAAGGVDAPDLVAAREAARSEGFAVALVEQPYRVAGRRAPARAPQLDAAWTAVVESLRADELAGLPQVRYVVGNSHKPQVGEIALNLLDEDFSTHGRAEILCSSIFLERELKPASHVGSAGRTR